MRTYREELSPDDRKALAAESKVGLVATVNEEGAPHITLITSLSAPEPGLLVFGEFCAGRSKTHLAAHPEAAWLAMTLDRRLYQGTARWKSSRREGPELDHLNRQPMFRYNAYTGVYAVHYLDLCSVTGPDPLPVARLLAGTAAAQALRFAPAGTAAAQALRLVLAGTSVSRSLRLASVGTAAARGIHLASVGVAAVQSLVLASAGAAAVASLRRAYARSHAGDAPLTPWAADLLNHPATLRFLSVVGDEGTPRLHPLVPATTADGRAVQFVVLGDAWPAKLDLGTQVAMFALNLKMQSVLVRGRLAGLRRLGPVAVGHLPVEWVYNTMPPLHGQVYPRRPLAPVSLT